MTGRPKKEYSFVSPEGERVDCVGLKNLCDQHGLSVSKMSDVHRGIGKSHRGWKLYSDDPIEDTYAMRLSSRHKTWLKRQAKLKGLSVELLVDEIIEQDRRKVRREMVEKDYD